MKLSRDAADSSASAGQPESAQDLLRVKDVTAAACRPLPVHEAGEVEALEIAERRRRGVQEPHTGASAGRCERFALHRAPDGGRQLVDRPMEIVMPAMRVR